jgi:electron transfer flavoprotein beta subunit
MKIVVCVKQVPEITDVKVNPETGTLVREGVTSILNPFCEYALDHAAQLKSTHQETEIIAITMGPPQAKSALFRCLELGADRAVLVSDRKFAGADTWATALTLSAAIKVCVPDFNLILMGKQAIDGDTAQVGPEVAEILNLPQIMYGAEMHLTTNKKRIRIKQETENGYDFQDVLTARTKELRVIAAEDLALDEAELGLIGSYTQVVKVFPPAQKTGGTILEDLEPEVAARKIAAYLREEKFI